MNFVLSFPSTFWRTKVSEQLGIEDERFLKICCEYVECHREDCGLGNHIPDDNLEDLITGVLLELDNKLGPYREKYQKLGQFEKHITNVELMDIFPIQWLKERFPNVAIVSLIEEYYNERTDESDQFHVQGRPSMGGVG